MFCKKILNLGISESRIKVHFIELKHESKSLADQHLNVQAKHNTWLYSCRSHLIMQQWGAWFLRHRPKHQPYTQVLVSLPDPWVSNMSLIFLMHFMLRIPQWHSSAFLPCVYNENNCLSTLYCNPLYIKLQCRHLVQSQLRLNTRAFSLSGWYRKWSVNAINIILNLLIVRFALI